MLVKLVMEPTLDGAVATLFTDQKRLARSARRLSGNRPGGPMPHERLGVRRELRATAGASG
jgi:hypothetical protein